jgi:N6-adenosine-specific RNA methylase IME4
MSTALTQRCYACGAEIRDCCYWFSHSEENGMTEGPLCQTCCITRNYAIDNPHLDHLLKLKKTIEEDPINCDNFYLPSDVAEEIRPGILDELNKANRINPLYKNKYDVLYLDPPWRYNDKAHAGKRGVEYKYQVMSDDEIAALPIGDLAKENCCLFLWTTCPKLDVALSVISDWGFTYKTVAFMWVKTTKHGKLFWGMGNWSRANGELCLLATKGKPKRVAKNVHQIVMAQRREHSRKPDEVRDRIVALCGKDSKRLELFARDPVPEDWDVWGDQCKNSLDLFGENE